MPSPAYGIPIFVHMPYWWLGIPAFLIVVALIYWSTRKWKY